MSGYIITKYVADRRIKSILMVLSRLDRRKIKILDVGCGNRYITNAIKRHGYNVVGIDRDKGGAKWMKGQKPDYVMDATKMTFKKESFDVVLALEVIEHCNCVPEIKRVLKKGGLFICSTPSPGTDWVRRIFVSLGLLQNQEFEGHDKLYHLRDIPMNLVYYKKMFFGVSQFGVFKK